MAIKRRNRYELTLRQIEMAKEDTAAEQLKLFVENHDEILAIIQKLKEKNIFGDQQQAAEFGIGIKLFSEVMIRNRDHLLFEDFLPAFRLFTTRLKKY